MKPNPKREHARELWRHLRGRGFVRGKDIPMNSRMIRAVCQEYPEHFLSTQQGYALVCEASEDEIRNAIADLRSRCAHMERRAAALEEVCN